MTLFIMNGWFIQHSKICVTSFIVNGQFIQLSKLPVSVCYEWQFIQLCTLNKLHKMLYQFFIARKFGTSDAH